MIYVQNTKNIYDYNINEGLDTIYGKYQDIISFYIFYETYCKIFSKLYKYNDTEIEILEDKLYASNDNKLMLLEYHYYDEYEGDNYILALCYNNKVLLLNNTIIIDDNIDIFRELTFNINNINDYVNIEDLYLRQLTLNISKYSINKILITLYNNIEKYKDKFQYDEDVISILNIFNNYEIEQKNDSDFGIVNYEKWENNLKKIKYFSGFSDYNQFTISTVYYTGYLS